MSDTPKIPTGQPTWCRRRSRGSVALPRSRRVGGVVNGYVPIRLQHMGTRTSRVVDVWLVQSREWSEGDIVEVGPLPKNCVVEFHIDRPWTPPILREVAA